MTNQPAPSDTPEENPKFSDGSPIFPNRDPETIIRNLKAEIARLSAEREKEREADLKAGHEHFNDAKKFALEIIEIKAVLSKCVVQLGHIKGGYILGSRIDEAHAMAVKLLERLATDSEKETFIGFPDCPHCGTNVVEVAQTRATLAERDKQLAEAQHERTEWRCSALLYHEELRRLADGRKVDTNLGFPVEKKIEDLQAQLAASERQRKEMEVRLAKALQISEVIEKEVKTIREQLAEAEKTINVQHELIKTGEARGMAKKEEEMNARDMNL